jgi:hypothetical protein
MLAIPVVEAVDEPLVAINDRSALGLTELLLKNSRRVDFLVRDETWQADLIPRFLGIAVTSFSVFSLALAIILSLVPTDYLPNVLRDAWQRNPTSAGFSLGLAYVLGLIAATGVCLPSFYFYGLLSGVRITVLQVTTHIIHGMAATALMLLGLLPIYVAYVLGLIVFEAPSSSLVPMIYAGLGLPFIAGLWGLRTIYRGFMQLADTLPPERRCRRQCFLRRLTLACTACYSAVTPVMIYTLWNTFSNSIWWDEILKW